MIGVPTCHILKALLSFPRYYLSYLRTTCRDAIAFLKQGKAAERKSHSPNREPMNRLFPRPGEKWRHYKGGQYTILAIATDFVTRETLVVYSSYASAAIPLVARHSETSSLFTICEHEGKIIAVSCDSGGWKAWVRPLDMFMGVVSSPLIGKLCSNCYRFERINELSK